MVCNCCYISDQLKAYDSFAVGFKLIKFLSIVWHPLLVAVHDASFDTAPIDGEIIVADEGENIN